MGKNSKKRGGPLDWEERADSDNRDGPVTLNSNESQGKTQSAEGKDDPQDARNNGEKFEDQDESDQQADPEFGQYLEAVDELETQMITGRKAMKNVQAFFTRQKREIQDAVETRRKLTAMTTRCEEYKRAIKIFHKENEKELARREAEFEAERKKLNKAQARAESERNELEEEKKKFEKRVSVTEAEQKAKLQEQREKLEKELNEKYEERAKLLESETEKRVKALESETKQHVELLEKESKERQDDATKRITELETKNDNLSEELEDQKSKLKKVEVKFKDVKTLKSAYEEKAERLEENLKLAKNEFKLNSETTESYKEKFLKIHSDVQDICSRYITELHVGDIKTLHNEIEKVDKDFAFVPISCSKASAELRVAHAQRVISSQLQNIIWQPFSADMTLQTPEQASLLGQISHGLVEYYGEIGGLRAARMCAALTMRGLQSQPPPSPSRAQVFTDKVMAVLSLLVEPSLHPDLRNSLLDLAMSAISVWDIAQTDERQIIVDFNLDTVSLEGWREDILPSHNGVIVLFPRVTARGCPRMIYNHPVGPPGTLVESEPELGVEEICIYAGAGLGRWSEVVMEGEEEEEERKAEEHNKELEDTRRALEESLKKLQNQVFTKRRTWA